jgi:hypothetical protein
MRSPVLAGIIGALRAWTVAMISALSMPCRWMLRHEAPCERRGLD